MGETARAQTAAAEAAAREMIAAYEKLRQRGVEIAELLTDRTWDEPAKHAALLADPWRVVWWQKLPEDEDYYDLEREVPVHILFNEEFFQAWRAGRLNARADAERQRKVESESNTAAYERATLAKLKAKYESGG